MSTRHTRMQVRAKGSKGEFVARVLTYGTIDDYGSVWLPGVFAESLATRMPVVAWGHQWTEPIGRFLGVSRDDRTALELVGRLDLHPDVPRARQAWAQLQSGTVNEWSVGFSREQWVDLDNPGAVVPGVEASQVEQWRQQNAWEVMVKASLDEVSVVLAGAVQGTDTLALRGRRRTSPPTPAPARRPAAAVRQPLSSYSSPVARALAAEADRALDRPLRRR